MKNLIFLFNSVICQLYSWTDAGFPVSCPTFVLIFMFNLWLLQSWCHFFVILSEDGYCIIMLDCEHSFFQLFCLAVFRTFCCLAGQFHHNQFALTSYFEALWEGCKSCPHMCLLSSSGCKSESTAADVVLSLPALTLVQMCAWFINSDLPQKLWNYAYWTWTMWNYAYWTWTTHQRITSAFYWLNYQNVGENKS